MSGNFAKNTGNIIAFDVIDTDDDSYAIYGKNTVTGKTDEIVSNTIIGYPNYSNKDDKLIYDARNTSADPVLAVVNLKDRRKSNFSTYSLGMKQRLAIASTLIGQPEVLIFDEPTNGLDPQGIAEVRDILKKIADTGKTVIMASHILDEVEKICSHVAIIKKGHLLATGPIGAIINSDVTVELAAADMQGLKTFLAELPMVKHLQMTGKTIEIGIDQHADHTVINKLAFEKGILLTHLVARKKKLETEFLEITSKN